MCGSTFVSSILRPLVLHPPSPSFTTTSTTVAAHPPSLCWTPWTCPTSALHDPCLDACSVTHPPAEQWRNPTRPRPRLRRHPCPSCIMMNTSCFRATISWWAYAVRDKMESLAREPARLAITSAKQNSHSKDKAGWSWFGIKSTRGSSLLQQSSGLQPSP